MTAATAASPVATRRRRVLGRDTRTAYLYLLPALLVMAIITFYPLLFQTWMSFTSFELKNLVNPGSAEWVGLSNYERILSNRLGLPNFDFLRMVMFNLWWAFSNVVLHLIIGIGIAILLNSPGLKFKKFYRALFILPVIIPPLIVATVWRNMFDPNNGAINLGLAGIGSLFKLPEAAFNIDWMRQVADPIAFVPLPLAYFALLTANVWLGWPLNSVVATGALQSIPNELYEAAEMDGASNWQKFKTVTLPFLRPAMVPYAIYGFVVTFNLFYLSYFMSGGNPAGKTELLVTQAYRLVQERRLFGVAAAFCVFMFFLLLVITIFTNKAAKATASYDA
jgi:arabinogalactan oligomer/maltooligosaccharide transport system permease protein